MISEMPATMNVYRVECSLSDVDSHFFPKSENSSSCSLLNVSITNTEPIAKKFGYKMKNEATNLSRIVISII